MRADLSHALCNLLDVYLYAVCCWAVYMYPLGKQIYATRAAIVRATVLSLCRPKPISILMHAPQLSQADAAAAVSMLLDHALYILA